MTDSAWDALRPDTLASLPETPASSARWVARMAREVRTNTPAATCEKAAGCITSAGKICTTHCFATARNAVVCGGQHPIDAFEEAIKPQNPLSSLHCQTPDCDSHRRSDFLAMHMALSAIPGSYRRTTQHSFPRLRCLSGPSDREFLA